MGFPRQEYWSQLSCPPLEESSQPRDWTCISYGSCIAGRFFTAEPLGKLFDIHNNKLLNSNDHFQIYKDISRILTHLILKATICGKANTGTSLFYGIIDSVDNFMEKLLYHQHSLYMHSMPGTHHWILPATFWDRWQLHASSIKKETKAQND